MHDGTGYGKRRAEKQKNLCNTTKKELVGIFFSENKIGNLNNYLILGVEFLLISLYNGSVYKSAGKQPSVRQFSGL